MKHQARAILLGSVGLLIAGAVGWNIGGGNYAQLVFAATVIVVGSFGLFAGRFFWVLTIASSYLGGTFPVLGGSFTPFQILMAMGVARFLIEDVVLRRRRLAVMNTFDLLLIAGFMAILTVHAIHDRFGMRFLGSDVWGGRNYLNVYVGLAAFFIIQSIPISSKLWAKLPYLILALAAFDLLIAVITTIFPASIYKIYPFYSAVSVAGMEEVISGSRVETARLGSVGNFGVMLIAIVFASVSLRQILKPPIFFRLVTIAVAAVAVLFSSFRSSVFNTLAICFLAGIRDLKWGILAFLPFIAALLLAVSMVNSAIWHLPKQVQRGLVFIPGDWDHDMVQDAADSNNFRKEVWTLWWREYFPVHPWFGRGFGFRNEWARGSVYKYDPFMNRQMVEVGNIHNGFFATLDTFGIVGTIFFVIWNIRILSRIFRVQFSRDGQYGMPLRFVALCLGGSILCYGMAALSVGTFLPQEFALAAVFIRLQRMVAEDDVPDRPATVKSDGDPRKELVPA